jgi:hypothetical protein
VQPAHHYQVQLGRRLAKHFQAVGGEVDAVLDQPAMDLTGEVVVITRAQSPDPRRISRDEGLGEDHQPRPCLGGRVEVRDRNVEGGSPVQQDGRLLHDRHPYHPVLALHASGL